MGTIIFDLLVFNGNEVNRFVSITFDGLKFDKKILNIFLILSQRLKLSKIISLLKIKICYLKVCYLVKKFLISHTNEYLKLHYHHLISSWFI